jgi:hypothetical protein
MVMSKVAAFVFVGRAIGRARSRWIYQNRVVEVDRLGTARGVHG